MDGSDDPIRILHIEDDLEFADIVSTFLERELDHGTVLTAGSAAEGLDRLAETTVDCVVSDYDMPDKNGIDLLTEVRDRYPTLPFFLFTGKGSEEVASQAISKGVTDYMQKSVGTEQFEILANRIGNAVAKYRVEADLHESEERYRKLVEQSHDAIYIYRDEQLLFVNDRAVELTGYRRAELLEIQPCDLVHPDDRDRIRDLAEGHPARSDEPKTFNARLVTADGEIKFCGFSTAPITIDDEPAVIGSIRELTEQDRMEQRFERLVEESPVVIAVHDENGTFRFVTEAATSVLGYEPEELEGESAFDFVHPADVGQVRDLYEGMIADPTERPITEFRFRHADGSWIYLEGRGRNLFDDPVIDGVVVYTQNVTMRRDREEELQRYERAVETVADGVYMLDDDYEFTMVNDTMIELSGYSRDELLGANLSKLLSDEDLKRAKQGREQLREDDKERMSIDVTVITKDGQEIPIEARYRLLRDGAGTVGVARDISNRRAYEDKIERQRRELEELNRVNATLREVTQGVVRATSREAIEQVVCDRLTESDAYLFAWIGIEDDGTMIPTTSAGGFDNYLEAVEVTTTESKTGRGPTGRAYQSLDVEVSQDHQSDPTFEPWRRASQAHGFSSSAAIPLVYEDTCYGILNLYAGQEGAFDADEQALLGELGRTIGHAIHAVEMDAQLEESLSELQQKNERLEAFAGVVSHDLRNPLNVASGSIEHYRETSDEVNLDRIDRALDRMEQIIDDVLTLAKAGDTIGQFTEVDLETVVEQAWDNVDTRDATLVVDITGRIRADQSRLQRALENLFRNAIDHVGQSVTVTVGGLSGGFFIEDDGSGIDADRRESVFEVGDDQADGFGLGLPIVGTIVRAHGWNIAITDAETGGARFEITEIEYVE